MKHEEATVPPAPLGQVERGVRPHAIRLASQLQSAAYSHGYEDGHPSNATTRQEKTSAASQRARNDLCAAIELLIAERDQARAALLTLANAADQVGVNHFDGDWLSEEVQAMQNATLHARELLRLCKKCGLPPGCPDCRAVHDVGLGA